MLPFGSGHIPPALTTLLLSDVAGVMGSDNVRPARQFRWSNQLISQVRGEWPDKGRLQPLVSPQQLHLCPDRPLWCHYRRRLWKGDISHKTGANYQHAGKSLLSFWKSNELFNGVFGRRYEGTHFFIMIKHVCCDRLIKNLDTIYLWIHLWGLSSLE